MKIFASALVALTLSACATEAPKEIDTTAAYEAFGAEMSPIDAVPIQAIVADADDLLGKPVKLEGRITEVCQSMGCWLSMQVVDGPLVRIDVPRDEDGAYVYTFPKDASGRRAVVSGVLTMGASHHEEGESEGDHDEMAAEGHDDRETEVMSESVYTLTATGALLERVRA